MATEPTQKPKRPARRRDSDLCVQRTWLQFTRTRDPEARRRLVERYMPLAHHLARQLAHGSEPYEDLLQVASLGLLKAVDRYDPARGCPFTSYAVPTIRGELRRHLRDHSWDIRPPRGLQERSLAVDLAISRLTSELERSPTVAEVAAVVDLDADEVLDAMQAAAVRRLSSLDAPAGESIDVPVHDVVGCRDRGYEQAEARVYAAGLTSVLSARERTILDLRFREELTQKEIGERVGFSQMHVSRVLRVALAKLHAAHSTQQ